MEREEQFDILWSLLRRFQEVGILQQMMLIGSWCLFFYRAALPESGGLPAIRTLDADFLLPHPRSIQREVDVPALLKELGFVPTHYRSSDWVVYDHPELRVEFLVPEIGRGYDKAQRVGKFHVTAQGLRYLNLLADYPRSISYNGLSIRVPEPAAFALQKLIVSTRRTGTEKSRRDLDTAIALLDWIFSHPREGDKLGEILKDLPKGWLRNVQGLANQHHPRLAELINSPLRRNA